MYKESMTMSIEFNRAAYERIFADLESFKEFCRFEGFVFNEKNLYKKGDNVWEAYQGWKKTGRVRPRNNNKRRKFKK
jgi:hypothetical protein